MISRRRNYKVSVRLKVKRRRMKWGAAFLFFAAILGAAVWAAPKAARSAANLRPPEWARWRYNFISVSGAPAEIFSGLEKTLGIKSGQELSGRDMAGLEKKILAAFPAIREAKAVRRWPGGELVLRITMRNPVAALTCAAQTRLVDENGELYSAEASTSALVRVEAESLPKKTVGSETAAVIKELSGLSEALRPSQVYLGKKSMALALSDGSRVDWGGTDFTSEKIARLSSVLGKAPSFFAGPYRVDLRYFEDGRILLSKLNAARP